MFIQKQQYLYKSIINHIVKNIHIDSFPTPNPNYLKFVPANKKVLGEGTLDISSIQYSTISPLAQALFAVPGITRVFYGADYLSVAKDQNFQWSILKPQVSRIISYHYDQKIPIIVGEAALDSEEIDPDDTETVQFIKEVLAARIRPTVQQDGGDVRFVSFDQQIGKLTLKLVGACSGCPSSSVTLKNGIEKMLTYYIKEVKEVVSED